MLDPGSALSLACNIIQIVDFSLKAVTKFRELYKDGASSENRELEDMALRLKNLRANLVTVDPLTRQSRPVFVGDEELQALADDCCKTADELTAELDTLKVSGPHKRRHAIRKLFRSIRRKSVVAGIQVKLDGYQKVLDTKILVNLRQRIDLAALQQDNDFKNLDSKVQVLIVSLKNQQSSFGQLSDLIREEHKSAKEHVTEEFDRHRKDREKAEYCNKYLDSLAFPGMYTRLETVPEPYSETFQWIFDESGKAVRPGGNFVEWLKNGQGFYWIQGKAGSGKSTLMSYICQDQRTEALLRTWTGAHDLLIVPFFFWKAGNERLQKNAAGLLRSLLHQILEKVPDLILPLAQISDDPQGFQTGIQGFPLIPAWTEKRLLMSFRRLLSELSNTHHLCLFIDGLDEIDGNQIELVELLQDRVKGSNMKMCLASRPDRSFKDAFSSPAMLRLEDLTREDIQLYVSRKLEAAWRKSPAVDDKYWVSHMIDNILTKAQGVFQWVRIVVEYQIRGFQSKDGMEELWKRLEELPEEIEELYAYILKKIDKVHRMEVASYLQIILQVDRAPSISELTLALYEKRDQLFSPRTKLPLVEIALQCTSVRERIQLICGGLLEFQDTQYFLMEIGGEESEFIDERLNSDQADPSSSVLRGNAFEQADATFHHNWTTYVHLIHRTAYDFLKNNQVGKDFLESSLSPTFDVYGPYIEARLAHIVIFAQDEEFYHGPSSQKRAWSRFPEASLSSGSSIASLPGLSSRKYKSSFKVEIETIMSLAVFVERQTNKAQTTFNKIDEVVTMVDEQYLRRRSDTHWCTRWGFPQEEVNWTLRTRPKNPQITENSSPNPPIVSLDFLCFAAYHGLYLYVLDGIPIRLERDDPDTATALLRFAMPMFDIAPSCLELAIALLKRGANPNVSKYSRKDSVWDIFLRDMRDQDEKKTPKATEEQWASAARTFIDSGADVNARITAKFKNPFAWIVSGDMGTELKRFEGVEVHAKMSTLAYLQDSIAPLPGFAEIRNKCIARGAVWTSKSCELVYELEYESEDSRKCWALSPRQSEDVDKLISAWSCQKAGRPVSLPLESLREMLLRLYHELGLRNYKDKIREAMKEQTRYMT